MNFEKKDIIAGKSLFTIKNEDTGNHFTFKVVKCEDKDIYFVSVLNGPDNNSDYTYIGTIFNNNFKSTKKSRVSPDAISFKAFNWLWNIFCKGVSIPQSITINHAGSCLRCGRKLTNPESIETGYGPVCITM